MRGDARDGDDDSGRRHLSDRRHRHVAVTSIEEPDTTKQAAPSPAADHLTVGILGAAPTASSPA
jgi:hypothetical protein